MHNSHTNLTKEGYDYLHMEETRRVTETRTQTHGATQPVENSERYKTKKVIFRSYQVIWYIVGVIETLLIFRVILKALAANPNSGFSSLIYTLSNPLALPFRGIFPTPAVSGAIFEWSTIVAGIVYIIVAWGIIQLFQMIKPTTPGEVERKVNNP